MQCNVQVRSSLDLLLIVFLAAAVTCTCTYSILYLTYLTYLARGRYSPYTSQTKKNRIRYLYRYIPEPLNTAHTRTSM